MTWLRFLCAMLVLLFLTTSADAGRLVKSKSCDGGSCTVELAKAPRVGMWPFSPPAPKPAPIPKPGPAPVLIVVPDACTPADQLVVEVPDRPGRHVLRATVGAIVKLPVKAVKACVKVAKLPMKVLVAGHERRAARRSGE